MGVYVLTFGCDHDAMWCAGRLKVMVDLLLLFGGYATVFLVSPKRNGAGGVAGAVPGSLTRSSLIGRGRPKVGTRRVCTGVYEPCNAA